MRVKFRCASYRVVSDEPLPEPDPQPADAQPAPEPVAPDDDKPKVKRNPRHYGKTHAPHWQLEQMRLRLRRLHMPRYADAEQFKIVSGEGYTPGAIVDADALLLMNIITGQVAVVPIEHGKKHKQLQA
jgi:hypothetical protein